MKIKILTLCDFAADYNGRLSLMGTTDQLTSSQFPSAPVSFSLACQFALDPDNKMGDHPVSIVFIEKESGSHIMSQQELRLSVAGSDPNVGRRLLANLIVKLDNISFPKPGTYIVNVKTEDDEDDVELYVKQL